VKNRMSVGKNTSRTQATEKVSCHSWALFKWI